MPQYGPSMVAESSAYLLIEGDPSFQLTLQSLPAEFGEEKSASYLSVPIPGRTEPYRVYMGGMPRRVTLPLLFVASVDEQDFGGYEYVRDRVTWCRSLVEPDVEGDDPTRGLVQGPPILRFIFGQFYDMRCIATSYSCTFSAPWSVYGEVEESTLNGSSAVTNNNVIDNFFKSVEAKATAAIKSAIGVGKDKNGPPGAGSKRAFPDLFPMRAAVQLTLEEVQLQPTTSRLIRRGVLS